MRRRTTWRRGAAGIAAVVLLSLAPTGPRPAAGDEAQDAETAYRAGLKRPSLYKRMQGRVRFARTGTVRALEVLAEDYAHPEDPRDHVRYLIATLAGESFSSVTDALPVFTAWRTRSQEPIDAWLWHRALVAERSLGGTAPTEVAVASGERALFRAAALRALAASSDVEAPTAVLEVLAHLPAADPDRAVLVEACSAVARGWNGYLKEDKYAPAVERIARTLDDATLTADTKDVVARNLAALFHTDVLAGGSAPWLRELAAAVERPSEAEPPEIQYAGGPFFGIRAQGRRVVYVIDASDSMLTPLSPEELKKLKPTTTSDDPPASGKLPPRKDAPEGIPWQKVKCRFDAAREVLKLSIRSLKPDVCFTVVLFGDDAKMLLATQGLKPADPKTVAAAAAELDRLTPTPAPGDKARPYGKLKGETNLHGGIRHAFRATTKGVLGPGEYVDLSRTGCDAVYVLSDGKPTTDDWKRLDKRDGEKAVKDRESMTPVEPPPELTFPGPYGHLPFEGYDWITDDVRRLNLFRQAVIHCVAIGEADDALLRGIADVGGGEFRRVGRE